MVFFCSFPSNVITIYSGHHPWGTYWFTDHPRTFFQLPRNPISCLPLKLVWPNWTYVSLGSNVPERSWVESGPAVKPSVWRPSHGLGDVFLVCVGTWRFEVSQSHHGLTKTQQHSWAADKRIGSSKQRFSPGWVNAWMEVFLDLQINWSTSAHPWWNVSCQMRIPQSPLVTREPPGESHPVLAHLQLKLFYLTCE